MHDGLLICKLINDAIPETIDERVLNKGTNLNNFKIHENQAVAINSAKAIGCNIINIGAQDLMDGAVRTLTCLPLPFSSPFNLSTFYAMIMMKANRFFFSFLRG